MPVVRLPHGAIAFATQTLIPPPPIPTINIILARKNHPSIHGQYAEFQRILLALYSAPAPPNIAKGTKIAMSSHIHPHKHPNQKVINELKKRKRSYFRTDEHYHLIFKVEKGKVSTKWSHF